MVKYEERERDATAPFHRSKYFFSFFFLFFLESLFVFVPGFIWLVSFFVFFFLFLAPRGLTNIWILLDDVSGILEASFILILNFLEIKCAMIDN